MLALRACRILHSYVPMACHNSPLSREHELYSSIFRQHGHPYHGKTPQSLRWGHLSAHNACCPCFAQQQRARVLGEEIQI